jgi:hypothetical protein
MSIAATFDNVTTKIDQWGRPAWIGLTVLGFFFWWPLGLAALAFAIGSGRMMGCCNWSRTRWHGFDSADRMSGWWQPSSRGNRAFDEYRADTLKRLEDEQREFREFLERLRAAKDRAEFDQFMSERRGRPSEAPPPQS